MTKCSGFAIIDTSTNHRENKMTVHLTKEDLANASIDTMLMDYNLSLKEIFNLTSYNVENAFAEVVAQYYMLRSLLRVANRYGDVEEANYYSMKIMEVDNDWFELSEGKFPLDTVETDNPQIFQKALEILETA